MTGLIIRKAKHEDSPQIAYCITLAMKDIVLHFIGEEKPEKALEFMQKLVSEKGNQYSYENCWVAEIKDEIVGAACIYDGAELQTLREPVAVKIKELFDRPFNPENETQAGEHYIDTVGIRPDLQGKGIGTMLFQFLMVEYAHKQNKTLGLLVEKENPKAKRLYTKLGFIKTGDKRLAGKPMEHLQYRNR